MSERICDMCRTRPAKHFLIRSDLGGQDIRMIVCGSPECEPKGEWQKLALNVDSLAQQGRQT